MSSKSFEVAIIGQGLAGSCLAMQLAQKNISTCIFDEGRKMTSSRIAAGMVNPITGRRFALSWRFEEWNAIARSFYQKAGKQFDVALIQDLSLYRTVNDSGHLDNVILRSGMSPFDQYIEYLPEIPSFLQLPTNCAGLFRIHQAWRLRINPFLDNVKGYFEQKNAYFKKKISYHDVRQEGDSWVINDVNCNYVVFCCGAQDARNPFFSNAPFQLNKGQALLLEQECSDVCVKNKLFKIPYEEGRVWLGTTNQWDWTHDNPEEDVTQAMLSDYGQYFTDSPNYLSTVAAIRPATKTRRPLILRSEQYQNMYLMGGLGSKGSLIAPGLAARLVDTIVEEAPLPVYS